MSCGYAPVEDQTEDCTAPGGMATDFNIWDRAMEDKELIDWTTCKLGNTLTHVDCYL